VAQQRLCVSKPTDCLGCCWHSSKLEPLVALALRILQALAVPIVCCPAAAAAVSHQMNFHHKQQTLELKIWLKILRMHLEPTV
jgi:hypothetical protein